MRRFILTLLTIALAAETTFAFPNFIPFFNLFAGGSRGGFRLLSESNLDWGQDLPALAAWQNRIRIARFISFIGEAQTRATMGSATSIFPEHRARRSDQSAGPGPARLRFQRRGAHQSIRPRKHERPF